jgi:hypothetical protein
MSDLPPLITRQNGFFKENRLFGEGSNFEENVFFEEVNFEEEVNRSIPLVKKASSENLLSVKVLCIRKYKSFN